MLLLLPHHWGFETHWLCAYHLLSGLSTDQYPLQCCSCHPHAHVVMPGHFRALRPLPLVYSYCLYSLPFPAWTSASSSYYNLPAHYYLHCFATTHIPTLSALPSLPLLSRCPSQSSALPISSARLSWPSRSQGFLSSLHSQSLQYGFSPLHPPQLKQPYTALLAALRVFCKLHFYITHELLCKISVDKSLGKREHLIFNCEADWYVFFLRLYYRLPEGGNTSLKLPYIPWIQTQH